MSTSSEAPDKSLPQEMTIVQGIFLNVVTRTREIREFNQGRLILGQKIDGPINSFEKSDYEGKVNFEEAVAASCLAKHGKSLYEGKKDESTGVYLFFSSLGMAAELRQTDSNESLDQQARQRVLSILPQKSIEPFREAIKKDKGLLGESVADAIAKGLKDKYSKDKDRSSEIIIQGVEQAKKLYKNYLKEAQKNI